MRQSSGSRRQAEAGRLWVWPGLNRHTVVCSFVHICQAMPGGQVAFSPLHSAKGSQPKDLYWAHGLKTRPSPYTLPPSRSQPGPLWLASYARPSKGHPQRQGASGACACDPGTQRLRKTYRRHIRTVHFGRFKSHRRVMRSIKVGRHPVLSAGRAGRTRYGIPDAAVYS